MSSFKFGSLIFNFLVICGLSASDVNSPNYFVDEFDDGYVAYPLDICVSTGLFSTMYAMYSCDAGNVLRTIYDDSDCTSMDTNGTMEFTTGDIESNGVYDYNCDGYTSSMEVTVCVASTTASCDSCVYGGTVYAVPDVCYYSGNGSVSMASCSGDDASITLYPSTDTCSGDSEQDFYATLTCDQFDTLETMFFNSQLLECVLDGVSQEPATTMMPDTETTMSAEPDTTAMTVKADTTAMTVNAETTAMSADAQTTMMSPDTETSMMSDMETTMMPDMETTMDQDGESNEDDSAYTFYNFKSIAYSTIALLLFSMF